jgi:hypothetical protein
MHLHEVLAMEFAALWLSVSSWLAVTKRAGSRAFAGSSYRVANRSDKAEVIIGSQFEKAVGHGR